MTVTLQEYLVGLGFHIDEPSFRRFLAATGAAEHAAIKLGLETVATAGAIGIAVEKVAATYEDLYYLSQRTGQSVAALQTYSFAARQIGLSAGEARSSIEGFYHAIRTNPGMAAFAKQLGASTPEELVKRLKAKYGERGYYIAQQIAGMFNQDETTVRKMWDNPEKMDQFKVRYNALMKDAGLDTVETTDKFMAFTTEINNLGVALSVLGTRISKDFVEPATWAVKKIDEMIEEFVKFDEKTGGTAGTVSTLGTSALAIYLAKKGYGWLFGKKAAAAASAAAGSTVAGGSVLGSVATGAMRLTGPLGMLLGSTTSTAGKAQDEPLSPEYRAAHGGVPLLPTPGQSGVKGSWYSQAPGWHDSGDRPNSNALGVPDSEQGFASPGRAGLGQWFDVTFPDGSVHKLRKTDVGPAAWTGRGIDISAAAASAAGYTPKTFPTDGRFDYTPHKEDEPIHGRFNPTIGPQSGGPAGGVNINQKTDIHINGGGDAKETAAKVKESMLDINSRLVRAAGLPLA